MQFQNAANANTPVEQVPVTEQLDPNWTRAFRLGSLQKPETCPLPSQAACPRSRGDYDYIQTSGFILRVGACAIDPATDTATWLLQAIDPNTGEVLQNATEGLLLAGQSGFVSYTMKPQSGLATGTQIAPDTDRAVQ